MDPSISENVRMEGHNPTNEPQGGIVLAVGDFHLRVSMTLRINLMHASEDSARIMYIGHINESISSKYSLRESHQDAYFAVTIPAGYTL